ncbi:hypothetical protein [Saccharopolyspora oryzae]|uniref:hypothetical protein n=1 Tax=Saccharopolyspora oryzae TaxID=2997343 RepID=UPI0038CD4A39
MPGRRYPLTASAHLTVLMVEVAGVGRVVATTPPNEGSPSSISVAAWSGSTSTRSKSSRLTTLGRCTATPDLRRPCGSGFGRFLKSLVSTASERIPVLICGGRTAVNRSGHSRKRRTSLPIACLRSMASSASRTSPTA